MNNAIHFHPEADNDIDDTVSYFQYELHLERTGDNFKEAVIKTAEMLADMPYIGRKRNYTNKKYRNLRVFPVSGFKYEIFYRTTADGIMVMRVLYAHRNYETLLS